MYYEIEQLWPLFSSLKVHLSTLRGSPLRDYMLIILLTGRLDNVGTRYAEQPKIPVDITLCHPGR